MADWHTYIQAHIQVIHMHTHIHTYIHTYIHTGRQAGRQAYIQAARQTTLHTISQANLQGYTHAGIQPDRKNNSRDIPTGRQAEKTCIPTDGQPGRHTYTYIHAYIHADRQTYREAYIHTCIHADRIGTHTYTHTYIHTYRDRDSQAGIHTYVRTHIHTIPYHTIHTYTQAGNTCRPAGSYSWVWGVDLDPSQPPSGQRVFKTPSALGLAILTGVRRAYIHTSIHPSIHAGIHTERDRHTTLHT